MPKYNLSLGDITDNIKMLMTEVSELNKEQTSILIYGIFLSQKENPEYTLKESIEYSKKNWSDLF